MSDNVNIRVQKGAVGNVLPTGTLKSANYATPFPKHNRGAGTGAAQEPGNA